MGIFTGLVIPILVFRGVKPAEKIFGTYFINKQKI